MSIKHHKTEYINAITHRMLVLKTINEAITIYQQYPILNEYKKKTLRIQFNGKAGSSKNWIRHFFQ